MSDRPCGTKTRAKNRYTRKELEAMAKAVNMKDVKKKTMDELCQELVFNKPTQASKQAQKHTTPTQQLLVQHVKPVHPCLINMQRPCSSLSKKPNRYKMTELRELWKKECKHLDEFAGVKPNTITAYCTVLRQRYARLKFTNIQEIPQKTKALLTTWVDRLKKMSSTMVQLKKVPRLMLQPIQYINMTGIGVPSRIRYFLDQLYTVPPVVLTKNESISLTCNNFDAYDPKKALLNKKYIVNKNVGVFSPIHTFLQRQTTYVLALSPEDKYRVTGYTYAGDKIVNTFLLGNFRKQNVISTTFQTTYLNQYLFPLALEFWLYFRHFPNDTTFFQHVFEIDVVMSSEKHNEVIAFFHAVKSSSHFQQAYRTVVYMIHEFGVLMKDSVWTTVVESYINHLTRIIHNAPRVPKEGMTVYRGVREHNFVRADPRKNIFLNQPFLSTTFDLCKALKTPFFNPVTNCCLFVIFVLPKTHGLFVTPISYFSESEILFPPGSQLFITRSIEKAPNSPYFVMHFALVN